MQLRPKGEGERKNTKSTKSTKRTKRTKRYIRLSLITIVLTLGIWVMSQPKAAAATVYSFLPATQQQEPPQNQEEQSSTLDPEQTTSSPSDTPSAPEGDVVVVIRNDNEDDYIIDPTQTPTLTPDPSTIPDLTVTEKETLQEAEAQLEQATEISNLWTEVVTAQTQIVETATQDLESVTSALSEATTQVIAQTEVVTAAASAVADAQAVVNAVTSPGLAVSVYSVLGQNSSPTLPPNAQPVHTYIDTDGINEQWHSGPVANSSLSEDVIVIYQGTWTPTQTGTTLLYAPGDDGVRLYLNDELVINDWYDKGGGGSVAEVSTTAGVAMDFELWYYENGGGANVFLYEFNATTNQWQIISGDQFSISSAFPEQLQQLSTAVEVLSTETSVLNSLVVSQTELQVSLAEAQENLSGEQTKLALYTEKKVEAELNVAAAQQVVLNTTPPTPTPPTPPTPEPEPTPPTPPTPEPEPEPTPEPEPEPTPPTPELEPETPEPEPPEPPVEPEPETPEPVEPEPVSPETPEKPEIPKLPSEPKDPTVPKDNSKPEPQPKPTDKEKVDSLVKDVLSDGKLTAKEKEAAVAALVTVFTEGVPSSILKELGISYADLPPNTPVELENGVVITAALADAFEMLAAPSELLGALFSDPGKVLKALSNLGADMSPEVREKGQKVVVAAIIVGGIAIQAAAAAAATSSSGSGSAPAGREGKTRVRTRNSRRTPRK
jgi:hypothetical protein